MTIKSKHTALPEEPDFTESEQSTEALEAEREVVQAIYNLVCALLHAHPAETDEINVLSSVMANMMLTSPNPKKWWKAMGEFTNEKYKEFNEQHKKLQAEEEKLGRTATGSSTVH